MLERSRRHAGTLDTKCWKSRDEMLVCIADSSDRSETLCWNLRAQTFVITRVAFELFDDDLYKLKRMQEKDDFHIRQWI